MYFEASSKTPKMDNANPSMIKSILKGFSVTVDKETRINPVIRTEIPLILMILVIRLFKPISSNLIDYTINNFYLVFRDYLSFPITF